MREIVAILSLLFLVESASSQSSDDPSSLWYRGYLKVQAAEKLVELERFQEGANALEGAFQTFKTLALQYPEFQPEAVRFRLQETAEERMRLIEVVEKLEELPEVDELEDELRQLKNQLRSLRVRKKELDEELEDLLGGGDLAAVPHLELPESHGFHSMLEDSHWLPYPELGEAKAEGQFPILDLFPEGSIILKDASGVYIILEDDSQAQIPRNWIPKFVDGEWTFIVPLVETPETRRFSKLTPVPTFQLRVLSVEGAP